jgi:hypothetical protein
MQKPRGLIHRIAACPQNDGGVRHEEWIQHLLSRECAHANGGLICALLAGMGFSKTL